MSLDVPVTDGGKREALTRAWSRYELFVAVGAATASTLKTDFLVTRYQG